MTKECKMKRNEKYVGTPPKGTEGQVTAEECENEIESDTQQNTTTIG